MIFLQNNEIETDLVIWEKPLKITRGNYINMKSYNIIIKNFKKIDS